MKNSKKPQNGSAALAVVMDEIIERLQRGEPVDWEEVAAQHQEHAHDLTELRGTLELLNAANTPGAGDSAAANQPAEPNDQTQQTLGDFRILRELGRGGMGVVYEAEQLSLGRRVALKVLPFAAMLDKQQLTRFKNEARAAATLDHPNIVAIHAVGSDRGVHYYAMQLIEGQSLAELIATMRQERGVRDEEQGNVEGRSMVEGRASRVVGKADFPTMSSKAHGEIEDTAATSEGLAISTSSSRQDGPGKGDLTTDHTPLPADTANAALSTTDGRDNVAFSTLPAYPSKAYFSAVVQLGIQAADALDHAHENGILHRDIKPANLLVDAAGKLWVTDFGLARIEQDAGLTMTGDILGTLRYMSPEQALAKRVIVDHRSDIYSLGITLYELLTLQPAFTGNDQQELLRQIAFEEPKVPRTLHGAIPEELQTIVLKAIAKNPGERYATANDLAEDLRRWLEHKPIAARPPGLVLKTKKWARRHSGPLFAAGAVFAVAAVALGITTYLAIQAYHRESVTRRQAERSNALAADNLNTALNTINEMLVQVSSEDLKYVPEADAVRKSLLATAVQLCQQLSQRSGDDTEVTLGLCRVYLELGNLARELGEFAQEEQHNHHSAELARGLIRRDENNVWAHEALIEALIADVEYHSLTPEKQVAAIQPLKEAIQARLRLPDSPRFVRLHGDAIWGHLGLSTEVMFQELPKIGERLEALRGKHGTDNEFLRAEADVYDSFGQLYEWGRKYVESVAAFRHAVESSKRAGIDFMVSEMRLQNVLRALHRFDEARDICQRSLQRELAIEERSPRRAQVMGRWAHWDTGRLELATGNAEAATKVLQPGAEKWRQAMLAGNTDRPWGFGAISETLAKAQSLDNDIDAVCKTWQADIDTWRTLAKREADEKLKNKHSGTRVAQVSTSGARAIWLELASEQMRFAVVQFRLGRIEAARATYGECLATFDRNQTAAVSELYYLACPFEELRNLPRVRDLAYSKRVHPEQVEFLRCLVSYREGDVQPLAKFSDDRQQDPERLVWSAAALAKSRGSRKDIERLCERAAKVWTSADYTKYIALVGRSQLALIELQRYFKIPTKHPLAQLLREEDMLGGHLYIASAVDSP